MHGQQNVKISNECLISGKDKDYPFTTVQIDHGAHPTSLPMRVNLKTDRSYT